MTYQRIILSGPTIDGEPGLPASLNGLSDATLADLAAALDPCPAEYDGIGYLPIAEADDIPAGKVSTGQAVGMVGGTPKWVHTLADAPTPSPRPITKGKFLELLQSEGGLTDADLVTAKADSNLAVMWIKLDIYTEVERDHVTTQAGLGALEALGYIDPAGKQAVLDAWPRV